MSKTYTCGLCKKESNNVVVFRNHLAVDGNYYYVCWDCKKEIQNDLSINDKKFFEHIKSRFGLKYVTEYRSVE